MQARPQETEHFHWGYEGESEPNEWPKHFKTGPHQSPINIQLHPECSAHLAATCCALDQLQLGAKLPRQQPPLAGSNHHHYQPHHHHRPAPAGQRSSASSSSSPASDSTSASSSPDSLGSRSTDSPDCSTDGASHCGEQQNTRLCNTNKKLFLGYPRFLSQMQLCNTGHGWQVSLPDELASHTLLSGPPLADREYRLAQVHCHWGRDCQHGSEHLVNGRGFAAEIHFVHWNCSEFISIEEAGKHKHGLAVLGVLVQALPGEQHRNKHLDKVIAALTKVETPGASVNIDSRLDLKKLFPANRWLYASYEGSLTTPPLSEVVDWIVFLNPISASESQIEQFRQLRCNSNQGNKQSLRHNCRPVQPLNGRVVSIWTHQ